MKAFQTFALTLEACEKTIQDLHSKSLEKFSNIDSNTEEIQKQLDDMSVSSYVAFVLAVVLHKMGDEKAFWNPNPPVLDHNIWFSQFLFRPKYVIFPTLFENKIWDFPYSISNLNQHFQRNWSSSMAVSWPSFLGNKPQPIADILKAVPNWRPKGLKHNTLALGLHIPTVYEAH